MYDNVVVEIVEQPAERFRYKCEGRSVILGANTTATDRSYPAIRVLNYTGSVVVVVSCVTSDKPYRQHPNNLIGDNCYRGGVCTISFKPDESAPSVYTFKNMGIQCCKKTDIETVLSDRERFRIDPFNAGFKHKSQKMNLTTVRLCFQVILRTGTKSDESEQLHPIPPVVSNIIRDKKYIGDFKIRDISDNSSPAIGGKKIMIFCDRISRDDIKIRFYREDTEKTVTWEGWGHFDKKNVHHQAGIAFKTPAYDNIDIDEPVNVFLQLVRPSDDRRSEPLYFKYVPDYSNINHSIKNKKRKIFESEALFQYVQGWEEDQRNRRKMEININPNTECNKVPSGSAAPPPNTNENCHIKPEVVSSAIKSNFNSNFSCEGAVGYNPANSSQQQQPYYQSQRLPQNFHPQNSSALLNSNYYSQRPQLQSNFSSQPQSNQLFHGQIQHNHMHPQSQYPSTHAQYQHLSQLPKRLRDEKPLIMPNDWKQQSQLNIGGVRQQPHPHQQYLHASNLHEMYSNPGYGEKNLSTSSTYNPLSSYQNSMQYNSMAQNQLSSNNNTPTVPEQQPNSCERNFDAKDILENMSDSFGSLVIETL